MSLFQLPIVQFVSHPERAVHYPPWIPVRLCAPYEKPEGEGYGLAIKHSWIELGRPDGLVVVEQDMAVSFEQFEELFRGVGTDTDIVWCLPYVLYPLTTGLGYRAWAHQKMDRHEASFFVPATEPCPQKPAYFGLGCTYLPAAVLEMSNRDHLSWDYPRTDTMFSNLARRLKRKATVVGSTVAHMHYG